MVRECPTPVRGIPLPLRGSARACLTAHRAGPNGAEADRPNKGLGFAEVTFAAAGYADQIAAYVAAVALANIRAKSFVATNDNMKTMDVALRPEPIGQIA